MGQIADRKRAVKEETATWDNKKWLKNYAPQIGIALPKSIDPDRFVRICMTELTRNSRLMECTPESFIGAVLQAAQCGLEIGPTIGQAYVIPYKRTATLQIGYKGLIQLCRRSGEISLVKAQTVYKNDEFNYSLGLNPDLVHIPAKGDRGEPVAYYAFYKTKDGFSDFEVMTYEEVLEHAHKYSKSSVYANGGGKVFKADSAWASDFDAMAKKTVLKKALKYAPMSTDFMSSISADETVNLVDIHQEPTKENDILNLTTQSVYELPDDTGAAEDAEIMEGEMVNG